MKTILLILKGIMLSVIALSQSNALKTDFVSNGKSYVLAYEPTSHSTGYNLGSLITKNICLYRIDDDSMRVASDIVCNDFYLTNRFTKKHHIDDTPKTGTIFKIVDSIVVIVGKASEWYSDNNTTTVYNTLTLFIPIDNNEYFPAYFVPDPKIEFADNLISCKSTTEGMILTYQSGTIVFKTVSNGIMFDADNSTIKLNRIVCSIPLIVEK